MVVSFWNVAHNVGGGAVGTLALVGVTLFGDWGAKFYFNAVIAAILAVIVFFLMRDTPEAYGLPPVEEYKNDYPPQYTADAERTFTYREIFVEHVLSNRYLWAIAVANAFVYFVRYGVDVVTVAADGSVLQTATAGSMEAAGAFPSPLGGLVLVFSDPPEMAQTTHRWDAETRAFVLLPPVVEPPPPEPTLDELKAVKLNAMQAAKAGKLAAMSYQGHRVTLQAIDIINVQAAAAVLAAQPAGTTMTWEVETGTFIEVDAAWLATLLSAGTAYVASVYAYAAQLQAQILASADEAALAAIDVTAGWP